MIRELSIAAPRTRLALMERNAAHILVTEVVLWCVLNLVSLVSISKYKACTNQCEALGTVCRYAWDCYKMPRMLSSILNDCGVNFRSKTSQFG